MKFAIINDVHIGQPDTGLNQFVSSQRDRVPQTQIHLL
jgi:hypothetical protein